MRANFLHLLPLIDRVAEVPGDFAEIGVWRGDTFMGLAERAQAEGRLSHAVDTFAGCMEPGPKDFSPDGSCEYPRGDLAADRTAFQARVAGFSNVRIHEGAVPDVFKSFRAAQKFAFVHVDLDHAVPTLDAISWVYNRLRPGGIVCSHDWIPGNDYLASAGIKAFMDRHAVGRSGRPVGFAPAALVALRRRHDGTGHRVGVRRIFDARPSRTGGGRSPAVGDRRI
jgi:SAM-dependent methyltransferase